MNDKRLFLEGFRNKTIASSIQRIVKLINQGSDAQFAATADLPVYFARGGKNLEGYYAFSLKQVLRFEFYKDNLVSVSVWDVGTSLGAAPKYIVQVHSTYALNAAKEVADAVLNGSASEPVTVEESAPRYHSKALQESTADDIKRFVNETGDDGEKFSVMYRKYLKWADATGARQVSDATFIDHLRRIRVGTGVGAKAPSAAVSVVPGVPDDPSNAQVEYDEFEREVLNNSVLYKYEMMAEITKRIVTWDPLYRNAFIYGVGGVGKTFSITQVVDRFAEKGSVVVYKGAISGFTGLLQVLWQNRERKVIIFDDNDTMLDIPAALNLLKGAMENADPRVLSYIRFKKGAPAKQEKGITIDISRLHENILATYINNELINESLVSAREALWFAKASRTEIEVHPMREAAADVTDEYSINDEEYALNPDIDPAYGMDPNENVPDQFQFTSRVIFISNLLKVPQPLMDRCISIGLLLTKEQILDLIESKLNFIMTKEAPQVTMETKKAVLEFMRKYVHRIGKPLTFRLFMQLCAIFHSGHPEAKKMAYMTMMGEGMKTPIR